METMFLSFFLLYPNYLTYLHICSDTSTLYNAALVFNVLVLFFSKSNLKNKFYVGGFG